MICGPQSYASYMSDRRALGAATVLTPDLAQEIAGETSGIIGLNVIITDADGIVMGSGDRSRVGTFHEASIEVIQTQRARTHNAAEARALSGVRPGLTLPIVHGGVGVGTVGITGTPARVRQFGQVVRRQTEILLDEAVLLRSRMTRERVLENLVRDLLDHDPDSLADITTRANDLGFDLALPRQAIVIEVAGSGELQAGAATSSPLRLIRDVFHHQQDISCSVSSTKHVVLRRCVEEAETWTAPDLLELTGLTERIEAQVGRRSRIGVGGVARGADAIAASYAEARIALGVGASTGRPPPYDIKYLRVEQLLTAVPGSVRSRVTDEVLGSLRSMGDWPTTRSTVITWVESGFVLVDAAVALNIHRNTLVYRLGRIAERAHLPTSDRRGWLALYLACVADRLSA
jgi:carbohydrate diacid regulator